ncbi:MAG: cell division FtsK/SpoIIIE [Parcubacteria group bacterium GW2011_GWA2_45_15]|nr:MAG: cell division FtsK/SpoIIIE [Parcubacteria group bacterium GW2011_GWA2_45_15]
MSRNRKKRTRDWEESSMSIFRLTSRETANGIFGVFSIVLSIFLLLGAFGLAGRAGTVVYDWLSYLFGFGYYLLPVVFLLLAASFLREQERDFAMPQIFGSLVLFLSSLGLVNLFSETGGIIGSFISRPLDSYFHIYFSAVVLSALVVISILVIFNASIKFDAISFIKRFLSKKETFPLAPLENAAIDKAVEEQARDSGLRINDSGIKQKPESKKDNDEFGPMLTRRSGKKWTPPPLSLLEGDRGKPGVGDIKANANLIKRTLMNFGIVVEMDEISIGPSVTRYALKPAEGVKLSRILALQNNLELALAAHPVRIEAPIPGKSLVGIEIPNTLKSIIGLGSLISDEQYTRSAVPLLVSLGRDIAGRTQFANLGRMPHLLIAGATGSGKTCAKDTYVFSENGMLTFEELCPLPLNSEVNYSLRVATRDGIETTSKNYNNGMCDFFKITTREGLSIEVTDEHPLWVIEDGSMRWKNGGGIGIGDYVAISRGSKLFGELEKIDFTPSLNKTNKAREIKTPTTMTESLGLFMGLLTADGGLTIGHRVVYTQMEGEVLDIYTGLLKELFGITAPIVAKSGQSNKAKDVIVNSKHLKEFLAHLGLTSARAQEKDIPRSIRQSRPEVIRAFIQGLIRNDGHVSRLKGLEITLANKTLLQQLQITLLNFGIVSSIHRKKVKYYEDNVYWRLTIYGGEFVTYAKEIGFLTTGEENRAKQVLALHRNTNKNNIPTLSPILKKLSLMYRRMFARLTNKGWLYQQNSPVPKYAFNNLKSYANGDRNPSYDALEKILGFYEPLSDSNQYKEVLKIKENAFYWAKVSNIEETVGEGYDFEVPGSHSFVGNGFVNHNSVTIHAIVTSLLFRNPPENLKFIMIDPKRVELTMYNNIPHLLTPVVTDPKKAILALKWTAKEMERRYDILEKNSVRDIDSYHQHAKDDKSMPFIIIIIDELADMMQSYPRELEAAVVRLAQMSRAVGIHLILSTQRPSVNIITGLIKANIPARIALQVSSQIDSRTILDSAGAEKLLGAGDMLFLSGETSKPLRIQSAYISEKEVKAVTKYLADAYADELHSDINLSGENTSNAIFTATLADDSYDGDDDELYEEARATVVQAGKASTSYLQRKLRIGYARAARLVDMLEERGVVGAGSGAKAREVIDREVPSVEETPGEENTGNDTL